jgi:hypothetical protein
MVLCASEKEEVSKWKTKRKIDGFFYFFENGELGVIGCAVRA